MTTHDAAGDFQRSTRMPLDAVVRLHFEGTVAFQNGFAANVSASGMFVKHPEPPPVGTRLVFEFGIGSQRRPVQGEGEVVWTREKYEGPGRPAGAGIRFANLDELSRQHLAEALFEFLEASLGDRVAEHPEIQQLVSSVPTHAPADLDLPDTAPEPATGPATPGQQLLPDISEAEGPARPPSGEFTPFRIFDEEPAPAPSESETVRVEIPSAAVPPPPTALISESFGGSAYGSTENLARVAVAPQARRTRWPLYLGLAAVLLAGAGFAAWWFLLREPARLTATGPAAEPSSPTGSSATEPSPPALDPEPGPETTLAETIGAARNAPEATRPAVRPRDAVEPEADSTAGEAPASSPVTSVSEITLAGVSGGTTVVLVGNGGFLEGRYSWSEIGGEKPRVLIRLRGMEQPFRGAVRTVPTAEVANVRTGYHPKPGGNELHVVLDLAPEARVAVESVEPAGSRLLLRLARR